MGGKKIPAILARKLCEIFYKIVHDIVLKRASFSSRPMMAQKVFCVPLRF